jgi:DNA processing protein
LSESPPCDDQVADELCLALVSGIGPRLRQLLLERFTSPADILAAPPSELRNVPGIGPKLSRAIAEARHEIDIDAEMALCHDNSIRLVIQQADDYPRSLREIPDPPGVLFCRGTLLPQDALAVAIVGSRHATHYGLQQAERLAAGLARAGLTIVSGLARGIDGAAHRGALSAGGRTIGVLGSGLLNVYPPEHKELAAQVIDSGALLSESPPHSPPASGAFPQRNRIITGMSLGVIIVEASTRSGALISARHAMEQGREVFAVPGRVDNRMAHGAHRLIRDGATLVETVDDVLEQLGPLVEATTLEDGDVVRHPAELQLGEQEQEVLQAIGAEPTTIDEVIGRTGLTPQKALSTVSVLEMRRLIRRVGGTRVMRA